MLLRHAQSTWNAQRLWQGQGDPPLSDAGRAEALAAAPRIAALAPELVVSSDLERARETARIVTRGLALELRVDPRWREWDVGEWSGKPRAEIELGWPELYRAFREGDPDVHPPGGERRRDLAARVRSAALELFESNPGRSVLVVTHRGAIHALLPDSAPQNLEIFRLDAASLSPPVEREERAEHPARPE
jgi:broad specificity phosphatase PhoE